MRTLYHHVAATRVFLCSLYCIFCDCRNSKKYKIQWIVHNAILINELFKLQKSAIIIISGASYNAHMDPLFKKLEILPLPDLVLFSKLQFMQKFCKTIFHHLLRTPGFETMLATSERMRSSYATMTNCNLYTLILWNSISFLSLTTRKFGSPFQMNKSKLFIKPQFLTSN